MSNMFDNIDLGDILDISFLTFDQMIETIGFAPEGWINSESELCEVHWKFIKHGGQAMVVDYCYDDCHEDEDGEYERGIIVRDPHSKESMKIYPDVVESLAVVKKTERVSFHMEIEDEYHMVAECWDTFKLGFDYEDDFDLEDQNERPHPQDCNYQFELTREQAHKLNDKLNQWLHSDVSVSLNRRAA